MQAFRELARLPRDLWIIALASFVNRLGTMALPLLTLYLVRGASFSPTAAGWVLFTYGVTSVVAAPLGGTLTDRYGPGLVMRVSMISSALVMCAIPIAHGMGPILAITVLWATTAEIFRPAVLTATGMLADAANRKAAFALTRLAVNLGMSVGPALGGLLMTISLPLVFFVDAATALAAGLLLCAAPLRALAERDATARLQTRTPSLAALRDRRLGIGFVGALLSSCIFMQSTGPFALFVTQDLGLPEYYFGLSFTLNTLLIVALEVPISAWTGDWPHSRTLSLGALLMGAGFGATALVDSYPALLATVVIWTFGEMLLFPGLSGYFSDIAPQGRAGQYMGFYTMAFGASFAVAPLAGNAVYEHFGQVYVWHSCSAIGILTVLLFIRAGRRKTE